jgi:hypothetical protein
LGRSFRLQYALPKREPFPPVVRFFQWYERNVLKVDTSNITVDRPIFLIGLPRSGTTMLQDIICARPDIAYITNSMHQYRGCFCAVENIRKRLGLDFRGERFLGDSVEVGPGSPNEGHMFYADWAGIDPYSLEPSELRIENFTPEQIEKGKEILRRVIWCFGGKARFFNKNPGHLTSILFMKDMHPDAKIIHIIRDPRKCANSMLKLYRKSKEQEAKVNAVLGIDDPDAREFIPYPRLPRLKEYIETYGPDDLRTTANIWNDAINYVDERKAQVPFYHEVRYEDILANPKGEITRLLEFCELPPVSGEKATEFEAKLNSVGVVEHRNKYSDFGIVEEICGDNMRKYGYL